MESKTAGLAYYRQVRVCGIFPLKYNLRRKTNEDESGFLLLLFGLFYFADGQEIRAQWLECRKSQEANLIIYVKVK